MKFSQIFVILSAAAVLVSCKGKEEKQMILVMSETNPKETLVGKMDEEFARLVNEKSKGTIKIQIEYKGSLGDESEILSEMRKKDSKIAFVRVSAFSMTESGNPRAALLAVPYTFRSREHFWDFAKSAVAQEILNEPYINEAGLKGLAYAEEGFRNFFGVQKIKGIEDFSGKKIRVAHDPVMEGIVRDLGAQPVELTFDSVLANLQVGTVDMAEQPVINYLANSFHKIAPNMILDEHTLGVVEIVASKGVWDSFDKKTQNLIWESAREASVFCRKISEQEEQAAFQRARDEGTVFVEVSDKEPLRKACSATIGEHTKIDPKLYKKIIELGRQ